MTEPDSPRPRYRHWSVFPAVLAVLALSACGTPHPTLTEHAAPAAPQPVDSGQQMLTDLAYVGIVSTDPAQMIQLGHKVCTAFDAGGTYWQIMASLKAGNYTTEQASKVVAVAAADMCPRYTPAVNAALTPPAQAAAVTAPAQGLPAGQFTDGTYLVGPDMPAGNYVTDGTGSDTASGSCYWSRNKNDGGAAGDIIKNSYASGPGRLTAKAGEVVTLQHGCTWTKK